VLGNFALSGPSRVKVIRLSSFGGIYVFNQATIDADTVITAESSSATIDLGTALNFNEDGSFTSASNSQPGPSCSARPSSAGSILS